MSGSRRISLILRRGRGAGEASVPKSRLEGPAAFEEIHAPQRAGFGEELAVELLAAQAGAGVMLGAAQQGRDGAGEERRGGAGAEREPAEARAPAGDLGIGDLDQAAAAFDHDPGGALSPRSR